MTVVVVNNDRKLDKSFAAQAFSTEPKLKIFLQNVSKYILDSSNLFSSPPHIDPNIPFRLSFLTHYRRHNKRNFKFIKYIFHFFSTIFIMSC